MPTASKTKLRTLFLVCLLGFCRFADANVRAPRALLFPASSALESPAQTPDLVVSEESLGFALTPYADDSRIDEAHPELAMVRAIYTIQVGQPGKYELSFVMPDATPAKVQLNEFDIPSTPPAPLGNIDAGHSKAWESRFQLVLPAGRNVVTVSYQQPVSAYEWNVGYFLRPKWHSVLRYELWPLKEWRLAPDFRLHVDISIEDDTAWLSRLIDGPRWRISACEENPQSQTEDRCLEPVRIETPPHRLLQHYESGPDFPDRLRIQITPE